MSIIQRDERRQQTVMIHICRLTVPTTIGYESVPVYLGFPRKWELCECAVSLPFHQSFYHFPPLTFKLGYIQSNLTAKQEVRKISVWAENRALITVLALMRTAVGTRELLFQCSFHLIHQHMHWLASQHGCVSDTAHAASWLAGILQTWEKDESNIHGALQSMKENWKNCREVTVILVGSTEAGHMSPGEQSSLDLGLFTDFHSGGAPI